MSRDYSYWLGDEFHGPIRNLRELKKARYYHSLGFFCNDVLIGHGELRFFSLSKKYLHTERMSLHRGFRRKGHGIPLYVTMIDVARRLGAKRIYSSSNLNKFSRRMWKTKLAKLYEVHVVKGCRRACRHCGRGERYYIEL